MQRQIIRTYAWTRGHKDKLSNVGSGNEVGGQGNRVIHNSSIDDDMHPEHGVASILRHKHDFQGRLSQPSRETVRLCAAAAVLK